MNKAILYGNVGQDPEVRNLESGKKVAKFSLATNKSYTNDAGEKITTTTWHNIQLWGKLAELAEKYVKKGNSLIIEGEIVYRSYENKEGKTVYVTDIVGNAMHFVGSKKEEPKENKSPAMSNIDELPGANDDIPEHIREQQNDSSQVDDLPY